MSKTNTTKTNINVNKLNSTGGKFATVVAKINGQTVNFCAKIVSATEKFVTLYDVNSERNRRLPTKSISRFRSGSLSFAM